MIAAHKIAAARAIIQARRHDPEPAAEDDAEVARLAALMHSDALEEFRKRATTTLAHDAAERAAGREPKGKPRP